MRLESPPRARTAIGLTSLIDVVFILLLFFMLTTQFGRQQAMRLALPAGDAAATSSVERLLVSLAADGRLSLAGDEGVEASELVTHPAIEAARAAGTPVIVVADDDVELRTFTRLMDTVARLGLPDVSVRGLR